MFTYVVGYIDTAGIIEYKGFDFKVDALRFIEILSVDGIEGKLYE